MFFGTNRARAQTSDAEGRYLNQPGTSVTYGKLAVTIPLNHRVGEIERPGFIYGLLFDPNPERHFTIQQFQGLSRSQLLAELSSRMRSEAGTGRRQALIFIHGYNVSFDMAAFRTAQISYDLKFSGAPVFYSWPSAFQETLYTHDASRIEEARPLIKQFLSDVIAQTNADRVFIIAHSMGNRGVTRALAELAQAHPEQTRKIAALILAAPDINATVFKNDIAPHLSRMARRVTLYASAEDKALAVSRKIAGARALGDASGGVQVMSGMDTIDATRAGTSFLGHSEYGDNPYLLGDIAGVLAGQPAQQRTWLRARPTPKGVYFEFDRLN